VEAGYNRLDMPLFRRIGLYGGLAAILVTLLLPTGVAFAQTASRPPLNLMTSPLPLNVTTKPGVPVTADIRIKNNGAQPEQLKVQLLKFGANGDSGQPKIEDPSPNDIYFNWVHFSEVNFDAEPNVWKTIHMTISPPKEAAFGYYYAVVFTRANPDKPTNGQSAFEGGVASLVLLSVDAPGARREAQVVSLMATRKVYEFLPASFNVKLHNSGNLHVAPTGTMFIKRGNAQVAALDFNNERGNILPGTNRVFSLDWSDGFPSYQDVKVGDKTKKALNWDFGKIQKLRFGRYTAQLVAVYDDGQRDVPVEAVVSFWVIPWRILGVILLITIFVGGGIWAFMRMIWRNIKRQALAGVQVVPAAPPAALPAEDAVPDSSAVTREKPVKTTRAAPEAPSSAPPPTATPVIIEPAPAENSLAAALGKRKKRSLFGWKFTKATDEPAAEAFPEPTAQPEQKRHDHGNNRKDTAKDRQRKKQKQQAAAAQPAQPDRPAQPKQQGNPHNWAQPSGKKNKQRGKKHGKRGRRHG